MRFLAVGAVLGEDAILGELVEEGDGFAERGFGFGFLAFSGEGLDLLDGGAGLGFAGGVGLTRFFVGAIAFDLRFDIRHDDNFLYVRAIVYRVGQVSAITFLRMRVRIISRS